MPKTARWFAIFIVLLGAFFYCYEYFLRIAPSVMQTQLMEAFKINATLFGSLSGFYYIAYTPMQLLVGVMVDRFRLRNILTMAILSCALGSLIFITTTNYEIAAVGRLLQGFGSAFAFVGALKLASRWLHVWWFASFSGTCTTLGFLGAAFGDITLTHAMQVMSWQAIIKIFVFMGFILALIFYISLAYADHHAKRMKLPHHTTTLKEAFTQLFKLIREPYIWTAGILGGLLFLPTIVFADLWGIPYLQKLHNYSLTQAGLVSAMIYIGWAIGSPFQGIISNLIKKRLRIIWLGALIAAITSSIVLYSPNLPFFAVCALFILFGMASSVEVLTFAMGRDICTHKTTGTAMAFINFLVMLSGMFMQKFVGWLLDLHWTGVIQNGIRVYSLSDYQHAIVVVPISLLIAVVLALLLKDKQLKLHSEQDQL
jgi:MFS family permease